MLKRIEDNPEKIIRVDLTIPHDENFEFRIVIIDDQDDVLEREKELVDRYFNAAGRKCKITTCCSPRWMIDDIKEQKGMYDLFLVDIEMGEMSGLDFVYEARILCPMAYFMFVTDHAQYAVDGYRYGIFRYIFKSVMDKAIPEALNAFCHSFEQEQPDLFVIKNGRTEVIVDKRDIRYAFYEYKYTEFYVDGKIYRERITLDDVYQKLNSSLFVQVNRSYIVNVRYIRRLDDKALYLLGENENKEIPVSRRRRADVLERIMQVCGLKGDRGGE